MWQPFPATVQCHTFFDDSTPFSFDIVAHHVDTSDVLEECSIVIKEIGDLWSLRDYEDRMIDRRPCQLRAWIARLETGSPLGDDTYWEVDVAYRQSHNIPGRYIAVGPSLQNITKEARSVSVSGRCSDWDFPLSHPICLLCILDDMGVGADYPLLRKYTENFTAWRQRWSKKNLNIIL